MGSEGYIAASGATARLRDLDVVSNNLANVGTPGFKRSESIFRAVLESSLRDPDGAAQRGAAGMAFVSTDQIGIDFARGSAQTTGSPLHAMIDGPGFFEIDTPRGSLFTRAGNFVVNRLGQLAAPTGDPVLGEGGPISIPDGQARIEVSGEVTDRNGNVLGRLKVVDFENLRRLERDGESGFRAPDGLEGKPVESITFLPESIEGSNVQSARELAELMILQRAYESNVKAMQVEDETTQSLIEGIR